MGDKKKSEDVPNVIEDIICLLERNIRGVQYGVYSVALGGLAIALWSVRPFKKFVRPTDLPQAFIQKHVPLNGNVIGVDFVPYPRLLVDHHPLIGNRFRQKGPGLPVIIEGVNITPNGVSWLQTVIVGQEVIFTPLVRYQDSVGCIVNCNKKSVANSLVSVGFACVGTYKESLDKDKLYVKYYQQLLADEAKAEKSASGMWWESEIPFSSVLLNAIKSKMPHLSFKLFKAPSSFRRSGKQSVKSST